MNIISAQKNLDSASVGEFTHVYIITGHKRPAGSPFNAQVKYPTSFTDGPYIRLSGLPGQFEIDVALAIAVGAEIAPDGSKVVGNVVIMGDVTNADAAAEERRTNNALLAKNLPDLSPLRRLGQNNGQFSDTTASLILRVNGTVRQSLMLRPLLSVIQAARTQWASSPLMPMDMVAAGTAVTDILPVPIGIGDRIEIECGSALIQSTVI